MFGAYLIHFLLVWRKCDSYQVASVLSAANFKKSAGFQGKGEHILKKYFSSRVLCTRPVYV